MAGTRSVASPGSSSSNRARVLSEPRRPATRSLSRITEDDSHDDGEEDTNITPRQTANHRRTSFASTSRQTRRSKSRTAISTTARGSDQHTPLVKRLKLRPSLAGPRVQEMDIETRAQVLIPIAEDCIVQLLRAGLNGGFHRESANEPWQLAWESLQSQRRNKLFSPDSLPFNDFEDVREAFHSSVRGHINTASLERAIHLSNLATFLWVILHPDKAHTLLGSAAGRTRASGRSRKPLGPGQVDDEDSQDVRDIVSRRNRVFGMAWKRYWKDVIPRSMRANKHSIKLWAHLSVQIMMTFRRKTVEGEDDAESMADLPLPDPEFATELFSASAIARYGQWTDGVATERDLATKETAQRRWADVAKHRRTELREVREEVLKERYPYDGFRRDILHFVDEAVLHTLLSNSVSPRKPDLDDVASSTSASGQEEDQVQGSQLDPGTALEADAEDETDVANGFQIKGLATVQAGRGTATPSIEPEEVDNALDLDLDLDLLAQVLKGMTPDDLGREDEPRTDDDDFPSEINSEEPDQRTIAVQTQGHTQSDDFPSEIHSAEDEQDQETDWAVKNASVPRIRTRKTEQSFQFAARQANAEQVAWESHSQSRTTKRKAKTPLFLPHLDSDSDGPASATPRAHKRTTRGIKDSARRSRVGEEDTVGRIDADDLYSMMPGPSILGTPARASRRQAGPPGLAPSPMRRGQSPANNSHNGATESEEERPSNSPSPQRPKDHGHELAAATPTASDRPVASSSRNPPSSSNARLPAVSQRVLVDSRKRRRTGAEGHFATASSSKRGSDHEMVPAAQRPAIRTPTPPRQMARRTLGPLRKDLRLLSESSARPSARPSNYERDLIIVPPMRPPTVYSDSGNGHDNEDANGDDNEDANGYDNENADEEEVASRAPDRSPTRSPEPIDFFLFDEDGSPLEPDPTYRIPPYHKPLPSILHGRKDNQTSQYTRISGKRKWTMDEQVLLYRTIQNVPLDEPSPLQVVWYLHGEYGTLSNDLEDFNVQHMKDKMKTVVQVRYNNRRLIEGRARFWLPPVPAPDGNGTVPHPDKIELAADLERAVKVRTGRERIANRKEAERLQREKDAEKAEKAEQAKKAKEAKKKGRKGKKGKKGKKRASRRSKTEDDPESEEEEEEEEVENNVEIDPHTPEEDESYVPKRSTRSKRATRQSTRGSGPKATGARQGPTRATSADTEVPEAITGDPDEVVTEVVTTNNSDARPPRRHRLVPIVELPPSRSSSRPRSRKTKAPITVQPSNPPDHPDPSQELVSAETPQHKVSESESEAETEYNGPPSHGKMMRRSIGQTEASPGQDTLSVSDSEDEDDEDHDTTASEEEHASEDAPDNEPAEVEETLSETVSVSPVEPSPAEAPKRGRGRPRGAGKKSSRGQQTRKSQAEAAVTPPEDEADQPFAETAPIEERLSDLLDQQPVTESEDEDDETDRLEQVARRLEIQQRVLRG